MFGGYDGYRKVLALSDVDMVILGTPPAFRPVHFEAAIKAGKHVFMEKPVAVDPPGARKVMEAGDLAKQKGLAVVAGTQRRYQKVYRENAYAVSHGAIGRILGGRIWWCGGALWYTHREANESDADYMVRNWVSFAEMSGDHIVEQHVHNIDVANWFIGRPPKMALGFGGRARRKTGDQFDFFSIDYDYGDDRHHPQHVPPGQRHVRSGQRALCGYGRQPLGGRQAAGQVRHGARLRRREPVCDRAS